MEKKGEYLKSNTCEWDLRTLTCLSKRRCISLISITPRLHRIFRFTIFIF